MSLRSPNKKQIHEGNVVKIYNRAGELQGRAKLLYRKPSKYIQDHLGYVKEEKSNLIQLPTMWIWSYEWWVVEWVEHPYYRSGDRSATEVHYFVRMTTDYPSYYDIGGTDITPTGKVVFLEEAGVLLVGKGNKYRPAAVKSLNKLAGRMRADLVVWTHDAKQVRERMDIAGVRGRVIAFMDNRQCDFVECVEQYLSEVEVIRYTIIAGDSAHKFRDHTELCPYLVAADPTYGLILK